MSEEDMAGVTGVQTSRLCAHQQCRCQVPLTQEYCSTFCFDADDVTDVEAHCSCGHDPCVLEVDAQLISNRSEDWAREIDDENI